MRPTNQKRTEMVRYVLTANTSHMSGLLKFGHICHLVRDREQVVVEPDDGRCGCAGNMAAQMHREDGHGLGEAVDARAPLLAEEEEDGGDQRSGVADADPPHEVGDVPGPVDRRVVTPDADAHREQVAR
jgi:hypothetical protein